MLGRKKIVQFLASCCIAVCCLLNSASGAGSVKPNATEPEKPAEKSYVLSYAMVGLGIALGLLGICRPRNRDHQPTFPSDA